MPDVFTKAKRSEVMSLIRSHGNQTTEGRLVQLMREQGITGWRRQVKLRVEKSRGGQGAEVEGQRSRGLAVEAPGYRLPPKSHPLAVRPDFVFRSQRVAVFVDGCFWHGCPRHATRPRQNRAFWDAKLTRNQERDRAVTRGLKKAGWTVLRIWECALTLKRAGRTMGRLRRALAR